MKYTLTKREKLLLYVLLCIILVVGGWYLLLEPSLKENQNSSSKLMDKETELVGVKSKYQQYSDAPLLAEKQKKEYEKQTEGIYSMLSNEDIDKILTELVLKNGLIPQNLTMEDVSSGEITAYSADSTSEDESSSDTSTEGNSIVKSVKVSLSVTGSLDGIKKVTDEISTNKGLKLQNFNYTLGTQENTEQTIVMNFVVYMMEK